MKKYLLYLFKILASAGITFLLLKSTGDARQAVCAVGGLITWYCLSEGE
jgi:hypothetical protein